MSTQKYTARAAEDLGKFEILHASAGSVRRATANDRPTGVSPRPFLSGQLAAVNSLEFGAQYFGVLSDACQANDVLYVSDPGELSPSGAGHRIGVANAAGSAGSYISFTFDPSQQDAGRKDGSVQIDGGTQTINFDSLKFDNAESTLVVSPTLTISKPTRGGRYMLWLNSDGADRTVTWVLGGGATIAPNSPQLPTTITSASTRIILDYSLSKNEFTITRDIDVQLAVDAETLLPDSTFALNANSAFTYYFSNELPSGVTMGVPTNLPPGPLIHLRFEESQPFPPSFPQGDGQYVWDSDEPSWQGPTTVEIKKVGSDYVLTGSSGVPVNAWWQIGERLMLRSLDGANPPTEMINGTVRLRDQSRGGTPRQAQPGGSYLFGGVSDEVQTTLPAEITYPFTLACQVYISSSGAGSDSIMFLNDASDGGSYIGFHYDHAAGALEIIRRDSVTNDIDGSGALTKDAWHSLIVRYNDATSYDFWVDGDKTSRSGLASVTPTGLDTFLLGQLRVIGPTNFFLGNLFDCRLFNRGLTDAEAVRIASIEFGKSDIGPINTLVWHKCNEGGTCEIAIDSSGQGNHGVISAAAIASFQDQTGVNTRFEFSNEVGYSRATNYSGSGEYYSKGSRLTSGSMAKFSIALWFWAPAAASKYLAAEYLATGNQKSWLFQYVSTGATRLITSGDGSTGNNSTSTPTLAANQWHHVAAVYNGSTVVLYHNGSAVASSESGSVPSSLHNTTSGFELASGNGNTIPWNGMLKGVVIEEEAWTAGEVASLYSGTLPAETATLWHFRDGDGTDVNGNIPAIAATGTPDPVCLPRDEAAPTKDAALGWPLTFTGQASHGPVLSSACLDLDGTADRVDCGLATGVFDFERTDPFSVSFWMKTPDTGNASIVGRMQSGTPYRGWEVAMASASSGQIRLSVISTNGSNEIKVSTDATYNDDAWHHVVATYDGSSTAAGVTLYVDGVAVASTIEQDTLSATIVHAVNFNFGSRNAGVGTYYNGRLSDARIYDVEKSAAQVALIHGGTNDTTNLVGHWPFAEGIGDVAHDQSGGQNHGQLSVASEVAAWATTQNMRDTLVTDGCTVAHRYQESEYWLHTGRLTGPSIAELSWAGWVYFNADGTIAGEWLNGSDQTWVADIGASKFRCLVSSTGTDAIIETADVALSQNRWYHLAFVYDGAAQTITLYVDSVAVASTTTGTIPTQVANNAAKFAIANIESGGTEWNGMLGRMVVEQVVWSPIDIANIKAGAVPSSVLADFRFGGGIDFTDAAIELTATGGTAERIPVPAGSGMPVTVGPGVEQPGQSDDLTADESNSPYAIAIAAAHGDTTYTVGDDDGPNDAFFARVNSDGSGDDRLIAALPPLTSQELLDMQEYTS